MIAMPRALVRAVGLRGGVERLAECAMPTKHGEFRAVGYVERRTRIEHVALVCGVVRDAGPILVRIHSECLTGESFGSTRCDCADQLAVALSQIAEAGAGVVVYVRGHEGRGIGLCNKIRAYRLQDDGCDTVEANLILGMPVDARRYDAALDILRDLGVASVDLLTNNPLKVSAVRGGGIHVHSQQHITTTVRVQNSRYLRTKRDVLGHTFL